MSPELAPSRRSQGAEGFSGSKGNAVVSLARSVGLGLTGSGPHATRQVCMQGWSSVTREAFAIQGLPMSDESFDQDAWLTRIRYSGPRTPALETLQALIAAHSATIA